MTALTGCGPDFQNEFDQYGASRVRSERWKGVWVGGPGARPSAEMPRKVLFLEERVPLE